MKTLRIVLWAMVAVAATVLGLQLAGVATLQNMKLDRLPFSAPFGGPFELTASDGSRFSSDRLAGRPYAVFFGFTHCPDICPTTLLDVTNHLRELGPAGERLAVLFVTVDPARDTPEKLRDYMASFDPRIVALTGSQDEIAKVARAYRIFYEKVATSGGYTMNHSAAMLLVDSNGQFSGTVSFQEPQATQLEKLRRHTTR